MSFDKPNRVGPEHAGCWISGHHGWRGIIRVIEIAEDYGFTMIPDDRKVVETYVNDSSATAILTDGSEVVDTLDYVVDVSDDAERFLNDAVAPDGYLWGWHDGEFFLQPEAWWAEEL